MRRAITFALVAAVAVGIAGPAGAARQSDPNGLFVVGDLSAAPGAHVQFWGAQWAKENRLSGGSAPAAFKGFAENVDLSSCDGWSTDPGNSAPPPASIASDITVIVAGAIDKSGPVISGDVVRLARVHVDAGYAGNPGHEGEGVVTEIMDVHCGGGGGGNM
jgi:hypothetical protein